MIRSALPGGRSTGIGALPHLDATAAAQFVLGDMDLPAIPALPRRSPAESSIALAMVGMPGITIGQYGAISVDARSLGKSLDPTLSLVTELDHDAFVGFRTFLAEARRQQTIRSEEGRPLSHVKWQFVGPITFGLTLVRAGVDSQAAFDIAVRAVRARVQHLLDAVDSALPGVEQIVMIEEPALTELLEPGFPLSVDCALDLLSGAMEMVERRATPGLHVCGMADIPLQLAAGPVVLSLPVHRDVVASAGYLERFLDQGGHVAWGVVATSGPFVPSVDRPWRQLMTLWGQLVERGVDPGALARQSLLTPECGLAAHSPAVARRVHSIVAEVARRVREYTKVSHSFVHA